MSEKQESLLNPAVAVFVVMTNKNQINSLWKWVNDNKAFMDTSMDSEEYSLFMKHHKLLQDVDNVKERLSKAVKLLQLSPVLEQLEFKEESK